MDRKIVVLGTGLLLIVLLGGFFLLSRNRSDDSAANPTTVPAVMNGTDQATNSSQNKKPQDVTINSKKLAANYFVFEQIEYEKARAANRPILLFFYANWCPTCARQEPINVETFNTLGPSNLIAFRVNYNDSDTSKAEDDIAKDLAITYQHNFRLFDASGSLISSFQGDTSKEELKSNLAEVTQ